jgi:hypothetical protein
VINVFRFAKQSLVRNYCTGFHQAAIEQLPQELTLLDRNTRDAGAYHAECTRGADRHIDDSPKNERSAIVDTATY